MLSGSERSGATAKLCDFGSAAPMEAAILKRPKPGLMAELLGGCGPGQAPFFQYLFAGF